MDDTTPQAQDPQPELEQLQQQLEECKKQADEYLNGWKRAKADYVNFKNDQEKRSRELAQFASMSSLLGYIPIVENLRTAFAHLPQELKGNEWVKGIEHIFSSMTDMLKSMGVEVYEGLVGQKFNPGEHQAVGQEQKGEFEDDVITQELSAGYRYHGNVISPAKVIVNKKQ